MTLKILSIKNWALPLIFKKKQFPCKVNLPSNTNILMENLLPALARKNQKSSSVPLWETSKSFLAPCVWSVQRGEESPSYHCCPSCSNTGHGLCGWKASKTWKAVILKTDLICLHVLWPTIFNMCLCLTLYPISSLIDFYGRCRKIVFWEGLFCRSGCPDSVL